MKQITSISNDAKQSMSFVLDNGEKINISLVYLESQLGWFISIIYGEVLTINNRRVVTSPNFLRAFRDILPFGISCTADNGQEPILIDTFSDGRCKLYVLNETDVEYVETTVIPEFNDYKV